MHGRTCTAAIAPTGIAASHWHPACTLHANVVDEVVICLEPEASAFVEPIARLCEDEGKVVRIPLEPVRLTVSGGVEDTFDGVPVLSLVYGPDRTVALLLKRLVNMLASSRRC